MGLFDRLWRVIRANINSLVGAAEDPEKILEQAVMDMQEDLIQLRQAVAGAIAAQKRTERQCSQAESTAAEWYQRAQLALQKGEENLAREALTRKKSYQETATAMKASLGQQNAVVTQLKENMRSLESKISEAKSKKDMYIARARSAKASERLQEMMGNLSTGSALSAFEKMEEKVMQLEARSEAIAELGTNDLEKKFLSLEAAGDVDAELAAMKTQMLPSKNTPKLPSGEPPTS
ncbi:MULTISPECIES: PspA/IM30 family protein [unclassified Microcoleus]|jgi:phage shock protein A|uniref:PspA/IM30 family protein n=1 Tax=unclassified Microcoleus TaxID=2642155 RepID=UPI001DC49D24|nr:MULTISPECIES: PspA/IM30 family protein [unclassified Microcoleus]MCC3420419.1 PspA/IM30 family protein [Microcoleus sp. PH2017_07_MST_O_A]MCC3508521.1 PspA/IM30 family protein [Microcoleus sp. PH2017_17_BER_D_A]TAE42388.1 MAG: PspA/IM30 family protein [Oscillatoriales cyanobacterium]MCC3414147.1 PspA/IM30 family protein [Microcoleus sp. PH2017_02_FOX_O_A]MCC3438679.1 PspA/IM30 family protein [Microcoleus sp. PH2017_05_CCC_O_A]